MTRIRSSCRPALPTFEPPKAGKVSSADLGSRAPFGSSAAAEAELPPRPVDLYGTAYGNFATQALEQVRRETYGEDFGQSSWVTGQEYRRFFGLLGLTAAHPVLDISCGSGGPPPFLSRRNRFPVTGGGINEGGRCPPL